MNQLCGTTFWRDNKSSKPVVLWNIGETLILFNILLLLCIFVTSNFSATPSSITLGNLRLRSYIYICSQPQTTLGHKKENMRKRWKIQILPEKSEMWTLSPCAGILYVASELHSYRSWLLCSSNIHFYSRITTTFWSHGCQNRRKRKPDLGGQVVSALVFHL